MFLELNEHLSKYTEITGVYYESLLIVFYMKHSIQVTTCCALSYWHPRLEESLQLHDRSTNNFKTYFINEAMDALNIS